jgi:general secretion pathway protein L
MAAWFGNLGIPMRRWRDSVSPRTSARVDGLRVDVVVPAGWPATGELQWFARDANGPHSAGYCREAKELPEAVRDRPVHLWLPARDCVLTRVALPTRSRRKLAQALPYALEDDLLAAPESMWLTWDPHAAGEVNVLVVDKARLESWLAAFRSAGIEPRSAAPITFAIPRVHDGWLLARLDDQVWLRTADDAGFALAIDDWRTPPYTLKVALAEARRNEHNKPYTLVVCNPGKGFDAAAWSEALDIEVLVDDTGFGDALGDKTRVNMLHGELRSQRSEDSILAAYRPAIVMLALWLLGAALVTASQWWSLTREHRALTDAMTRIFVQTFPDQASVVVDPYQQMQRNLARVQPGSHTALQSGLSTMLIDTAPVLARAGLGLQHLGYTPGNLSFTVTAGGYGALDAAKAALAEAGFTVSVDRSEKHDNTVTAVLQLRRQQ